MIREHFEKIYNGMNPDEIPWNRPEPPPPLIELVESGKIIPCDSIDIGCGTGSSVLYLAEKGFNATGVDFSPTAINMARYRAENKKLKCRFISADIINEPEMIENKFDFASDWGVLHHVFPEHREAYLRNVYNFLKPGGHYMSVCFSEKNEQFEGNGKYRSTSLGTILYFSSEEEIRQLFERFFTVEEVKTIDVEGKSGMHKMVYAFTRKL